jgi:AcrR family transcriptional regulator
VTPKVIPAPPGRREGRKRRHRDALYAAAGRLFGERGFDAVTVAEIAAEAGISVKTLFQYVHAKEDLLFAGEAEAISALVAAIRDRGETSVLQAVTAHLLLEIADEDADGLERFHRMVGSSPSVAARLRTMWDHFEGSLARELADEANEAIPSPRTRLAAAQLISLMRVTTSPEARAFVARYPSNDDRAGLEAWILEAAELIGAGLRDYAPRG